MVKVVFAWEEGLAINHFGHDAANRPDIDGGTIRSAADDQLWRPIPPSCDVVSHFEVTRNGACETEVADFKGIASANQHVLGFDVSVDDVDGVHVGDALDEVVGVMPDCLRRDGSLLDYL